MSNLTDMIKIDNCPICGKRFVIPSENIYKLPIRGRIKHCCSYTCYRKAKGKYESVTSQQRRAGL